MKKPRSLDFSSWIGPLLLRVVVLLTSAVVTLSATAQTYLQEYGVLKSSVMKMRLPVRDVSKQSVKINVRDKLTGKRASFNLSQSASRQWYVGSYSIDFVGNQYDFPVLEYSIEGSREKLYVFIEPTVSTSEIALFPTVSEIAVYSKQREYDNFRSGKSQTELAQLKDKTSAKEQMSFEASEAIRQADLLKAQQAMSEAERAKRAKQAEELIRQADEKYFKAQYAEAVSLYKKAAELDPSNEKIYYKYGVSLYKVDDYNKSLAMLSMAEGGPQDRVEHNFYVALNKMKLKDFDRALEDFKDVQQENDKNLSPMAAYLAGEIEYQQQKYDDAKKSYEYVLDNSSDKALDKQAESRIEEIDKILTYLASTKDVLRYGLNLGLMSDGNVLNLAQNSVPLAAAGYRTMYGGNVWYALNQSMGKELGLNASFSDMYTVDKNFKANTTLQSADPQVLAFGLPYKSSLQMFGKIFAWNLNPSYSNTYMSAETSTRSHILDTMSLATDISYQSSADWVATYRLGFDQDISYLSSSVGNNNQSALRTTLGTAQTKIIDAKSSTFLVTDFSYAMNNAVGKNNTYNKMVLGMTYIWPTIFAATGMGKAELTDLQYPLNSNSRHDVTASLTVGASKQLTTSLGLTTSLQYMNNGSTVGSDIYDKFVILAMLSYTGTVQRK